SYNRFQACRFGLEGQVIDAVTGAIVPLHQDVLATVAKVRPYAEKLKSGLALEAIESIVRVYGNQARRQRETYERSRSLTEVILDSAMCWAGRDR
ncbi:MAG TPA: glutamate--cysteine ligase, partial [Burkholderiaceae bacterium]|nr:glutamate--cysteine ligase [Burkholderiaceae bacterium]